MATLRERSQYPSSYEYDDYDDYDVEPPARDKALFALLNLMPFIGDTVRFAGRHSGKAVLALAAVALMALGTQYMERTGPDRSSTTSVSSSHQDADVTGSVSR